MRGICEHMNGVGIDSNNVETARAIVEEKQTSKKHTYYKVLLLTFFLLKRTLTKFEAHNKIIIQLMGDIQLIFSFLKKKYLLNYSISKRLKLVTE